MGKMRDQYLLVVAVLILAACTHKGLAYSEDERVDRFLQSGGRVGRPPRPPIAPSPPPPPPFPAAQPIRLAVGSNQCLDIVGGTAVNNARLGPANCNANSLTQKFIILNTGNGVLRFYSASNTRYCVTAWALYDGAPPADDSEDTGLGGTDLFNNGAVRLWDCFWDDEGQQLKPTAQGAGWSLQPKFATLNCITLDSATSSLLMAPCFTDLPVQTFIFSAGVPSSSPPPTARSPSPSPTQSPSPPPPPSPKPPRNVKSPPPSPPPPVVQPPPPKVAQSPSPVVQPPPPKVEQSPPPPVRVSKSPKPPPAGKSPPPVPPPPSLTPPSSPKRVRSPRLV